MSIEVRPQALVASATACDRATRTVVGVLGAVRAQGAPDTGRADTRAQVAALLRRFDQALVAMGATWDADARALRRSSLGYREVDAIAVPPGRR